MKYFIGNNWPCINPKNEKRVRSKSSLQFGEEMSWLLEDNWTERWIDQNSTLCNLDRNLHTVGDETVQKHFVHSFLLFTEVTSNSNNSNIKVLIILENLFNMSWAVRLWSCRWNYQVQPGRHVRVQSERGLRWSGSDKSSFTSSSRHHLPQHGEQPGSQLIHILLPQYNLSP